MTVQDLNNIVEHAPEAPSRVIAASVRKYMTAIAAKGGRSGCGKKKRRGSKVYYKKLAAKRWENERKEAKIA